MVEKVTSLSDLGTDYQLQLFNEIITDHKFGLSVIDVIDKHFFTNESFAKIAHIIKNYYEQHNCLLNFPALKIEVHANVPQSAETFKQQLLDTIDNIQKCKINNLNVQETAQRFCKMQSLKVAVNQIKSKLDKGILQDVDVIEDVLKKALTFKTMEDPISLDYEIDSVLADDYRDPIATGIEGIDNVTNGGLAKGEFGLIIAPLGVGKAQPLTAKVLTPTGWKLMGDINKDDLVISSNGLPTKVLDVYPQTGKREVYVVEFNDGTKTECDIDHLWSVNSLNMRNGSTHIKGKRVKVNNTSYKVLSLRDIISDGVYKRKQLNYRIPLTKPINFNNKPLSINPYIMGCLLGDGYFKRRSLTTSDVEIVESFKKVMNCNVYDRTRNNGYKTLYEVSLLDFKNDLTKYYSEDLKSSDKYIHDDYKFNSIENRLELLKGLMDTDGFVSKCGRIQFSSKSKRLVNDVREIVLSLGGYCGSIRNKKTRYKNKSNVFIDCGLSYVITMSFTDKLFLPFKLKRKLDRCVIRDKYSQSKFISNITFKGFEETKCILVEDHSHEYITDDYIVTHNTTILCKISANAYMQGKNVLQIFFEDNYRDVQRKHYSSITGIPLYELSERKEEVKERLAHELGKPGVGKLFLLKLPSDGCTVGVIRNIMKRINSKGEKIDELILDYLDCLSFDKQSVGSEEWSNEGKITRQFEGLVAEMNVAGWAATQGNRESTSVEVVKTENMGGSLKKAQIAHLIISIGKTLTQKESKRATISILKNRMGDDGMVFSNCVFDNGKMLIDTSDVLTIQGFEDREQNARNERVRKELAKVREERERKGI